MARETFAAARVRLLVEAEAAGLPVQRRALKAPWAPLKAPRITFANGSTIELAAQSAHLLPSGASLFLDYRGMSLAELTRHV